MAEIIFPEGCRTSGRLSSEIMRRLGRVFATFVMLVSREMKPVGMMVAMVGRVMVRERRHCGQ
jgi:hypothetical protein